jgi:hypothetical protein
MIMNRKCSNTFVRQEPHMKLSSVSSLAVFLSFDTTVYVAYTGRTAISQFRYANAKHLEVQNINNFWILIAYNYIIRSFL